MIFLVTLPYQMPLGTPVTHHPDGEVIGEVKEVHQTVIGYAHTCEVRDGVIEIGAASGTFSMGAINGL